MKRTYLSLAALVTLCFSLLLISGCGSSGNKEGDGPVAVVAAAACTTCHSTTVEVLTGDTIVANYTASIHNLNSVGCQDCHGAGGSHNGVGPIPYPKPNQEQCKTCHDSGTATSYALVTAYEGSNHMNAALEESKVCNRCHHHQGAVLGAKNHFTGNGDVMDAEVNAPGDLVAADAEPIKCNTCHETHDAKTLRVDTAWLPSTTVGVYTAGNDQYRLCTQCHGYIDSNAYGNKLMGSGTAASGTNVVGHHDTSWYRIVGTTHYDNPATGYGLATNLIEGYVLRHNGTNPNPCYDCHGHEANAGTRNGRTTTPTIFTDWARSGHAGGMLTAKYAAADANPTSGSRGSVEANTTGHAQVDAVMASGSDPVNYTWAHYPWNNTSSRGSCQKCHTATGVANYLDDPTAYAADGSGNDFSHLSGWTAGTGSPQAELLYCWGCHSNAGAGTLRDPGAVTLTATYQGAAITLPDGGKSNGCYSCHGGYGNIMGARSSRFMAHHAAAATVLFGKETKIGYQYAGKDYSNPSHFEHDTIGIADGDGPCVSCHMKSSSSHSFNVATKDDAGVITAIKTQAVCDTCHTGNYALTAAKLEEESEGYQNAGALLLAYVANTIPNYLGVAITSDNYATVAEGAYGAFQNAKLHTEEKGGFAHNRYLVKRLIFDGIDWMDNGVLDGTITINSATYPEAAAWFRANATTGVATRP